MSNALHTPKQNPNVLQQLDLYRQAESPDVYALHDFIESVIGGSETRGDFTGSLRTIADGGRLGDFKSIVEKFNRIAADAVHDEADLRIFTRLVEDARDAIEVLEGIRIDQAHEPNPVRLNIARNTFNTEGDLYRALRKRAG